MPFSNLTFVKIGYKRIRNSFIVKILTKKVKRCFRAKRRSFHFFFFEIRWVYPNVPFP